MCFGIPTSDRRLPAPAIVIARRPKSYRMAWVLCAALTTGLVNAQGPVNGSTGLASVRSNSIELGSRYGELLDLSSPCTGCWEWFGKGVIGVDLLGRVPLQAEGAYFSRRPINGPRTSFRIGLDVSRFKQMQRNVADSSLSVVDGQLDSIAHEIRGAKADLAYWDLVVKGAAVSQPVTAHEGPIEHGGGDALLQGRVDTLAQPADTVLEPSGPALTVIGVDTALVRRQAVASRLQELEGVQDQLRGKAAVLTAARDSLAGIPQLRWLERVEFLDVGQFAAAHIPLVVQGILLNGARIGVKDGELSVHAQYGTTVRMGPDAFPESRDIGAWSQQLLGIAPLGEVRGDRLFSVGATYGTGSRAAVGFTALMGWRQLGTEPSLVSSRNTVVGVNGRVSLIDGLDLVLAFSTSGMGFRADQPETAPSDRSVVPKDDTGLAYSADLDYRPRSGTRLSIGVSRVGSEFVSYGIAFMNKDRWLWRLVLEQRLGKRLQITANVEHEDRRNVSGATFLRFIGRTRLQWRISNAWRFDYGWSSVRYTTAFEALPADPVGTIQVHRAALVHRGRIGKNKVTAHLVALHMDRVEQDSVKSGDGTSMLQFALVGQGPKNSTMSWNVGLHSANNSDDDWIPRTSLQLAHKLRRALELGVDVSAWADPAVRVGGGALVGISVVRGVDLSVAYRYDAINDNFLVENFDSSRSHVSIVRLSLKASW